MHCADVADKPAVLIMHTNYTFTLGESAKEFAEKELGETDESREQAIAELRQWLCENPKLNAKTDDVSILYFLRGCKFDVERTKQKLRNFYVMKAERPEWFTNRDPLLPEIQELVKLGVFVPLRKYLDNRLVVIIPCGCAQSQDSSAGRRLQNGEDVAGYRRFGTRERFCLRSHRYLRFEGSFIGPCPTASAECGQESCVRMAELPLQAEAARVY